MKRRTDTTFERPNRIGLEIITVLDVDRRGTTCVVETVRNDGVDIPARVVRIGHNGIPKKILEAAL